MASAKCPPRAELEAFLTGVLHAPAMDRVAAHVEACSTCQDVLDEIERASTDPFRSTPTLAWGLTRYMEETQANQGPWLEAAPSAAPSGAAETLQPITSVAWFLATLANLRLLDSRKTAELSRTPQRWSDAQGLAEELVHRRWLTAFQAERVLQGRGGELVWDDYLLCDRVGAGGMGVVYKALQVPLGRLVAIKTLASGAWSGAHNGGLARFRAEAEAVARLEHENIVKVYDWRERHGQPFYVMEYVDGGDLRQKLAGKVQPSREAARLVQILAQAVHYAHQQGLVHRDLKPSNVLITRSGVVKITDFGLAKSLADERDWTQTGDVVGTPCYMAPEQAQGRKREIGPRSDVYALGVILYEMVTGVQPFCGETALDILAQVVRSDPVPPRRLQPGVPRDLETICLKCLEKSPEARYATALALADDLGRFLENRPLAARPVGPIGRSWRWCKREPAKAALAAVTALAAAALVALAVAAVYSGKLETAYQATESHLQSSLYAGDIRRAQQAWSNGAVQDARTFLDRQVPQGGAEDRREFSWRYLDGLTKDGGLAVFPGHRGLIRAAAFSPDSRLAATGGLDGVVKLWDVAARREVRSLVPTYTGVGVLFTERQEGVFVQRLMPGGAAERDGRLKPEDRLLAIKDPQGEWISLDSTPFRDAVKLLRREAGARVELEILPSGAAQSEVYVLEPMKTEQRSPVTQLAFSPDGRTLAVGHEDGQVRLWSLNDGQVQASLAAGTPPSDNVSPKIALAFSPDARWLATCGPGQPVKIWSLDAPAEPARVIDESDAGTVAFSPDGRTLVLTTWRNEIKLFDPENGQEVFQDRVAMNHLSAIAFSPDGAWLAIGGDQDLKRAMVAILNLATKQVDRYCPIANGLSPWELNFTPDGRTLAVTTANGMLEMFDVQTALPAGVWRGHVGGVRAAAFSPDGALLLTGGFDGRAILWDLSRPGESEVIRGLSRGRVEALAFVPGQNALVVAGGSAAPGRLPTTPGDLAIYDLAQRKTRYLNAPPDPITAVAFSGDGKTFAAAMGSNDLSGKPGEVWVFDAEGNRRRVLAGFPGPVTSAAYAPDGKTLAVSVGEQGELRLYDAATGRLVKSLRNDCREIGPVAFSAQGELLAALGKAERRPPQLDIWEVSTGRLRASYKVWGLNAHALAFSPNGRTLAVGGGAMGAPGEVRLVEVATGQTQVLPTVHQAQVTSLAFSSEGQWLAAGSWDATVHLWDTRQQSWRAPPLPHGVYVESVSFAPGQNLLAAAGSGYPDFPSELTVWNAESGEKVASFQSQTDWFSSVAFAPDGQTLATGGSEGNLRLWRIGSNDAPKNLRTREPDRQAGHTGAVLCAAVSPDGKLLATGSEDKTVGLWRLPEGSLEARLPDHGAAVRRVAISSDASLLAAWSENNVLRIWRLASRSLEYESPPLPSPIADLEFVPRTDELAWLTAAGEVRFWDCRRKSLVRVVKQDEAISCMVFFPNQATLVTGGREGTLSRWEAASPRAKITWKGHSWTVASVAVSPDGKTLASAGSDGMLRLWQADTGEDLLTLPLAVEDVSSPGIAFSSDGATLVAGGRATGLSDLSGAVQVWRAPSQLLSQPKADK